MRPVYHITSQKYYNQDSNNLTGFTLGNQQFYFNVVSISVDESQKVIFSLS